MLQTSVRVAEEETSSRQHFWTFLLERVLSWQSHSPPGTKVLSSGLCDLQQRQHQVTNRAVRLERIRAARSWVSGVHFPLHCEPL